MTPNRNWIWNRSSTQNQTSTERGDGDKSEELPAGRRWRDLSAATVAQRTMMSQKIPYVSRWVTACAHYFWAAFYFRNSDDNKQHTRTNTHTRTDSHSGRDSFSLRDLFPNIHQCDARIKHTWIHTCAHTLAEEYIRSILQGLLMRCRLLSAPSSPRHQSSRRGRWDGIDRLLSGIDWDGNKRTARDGNVLFKATFDWKNDRVDLIKLDNFILINRLA